MYKRECKVGIYGKAYEMSYLTANWLDSNTGIVMYKDTCTSMNIIEQSKCDNEITQLKKPMRHFNNDFAVKTTH